MICSAGFAECDTQIVIISAAFLGPVVTGRPDSMPPRRDYFRPGEAGARAVMHVRGQPQDVYPDSVKVLCRKDAASRMPVAPYACPQCGRRTKFFARLCYMIGVAGAYVFVVSTRISLPQILSYADYVGGALQTSSLADSNRSLRCTIG